MSRIHALPPTSTVSFPSCLYYRDKTSGVFIATIFQSVYRNMWKSGMQKMVGSILPNNDQKIDVTNFPTGTYFFLRFIVPTRLLQESLTVDILFWNKKCYIHYWRSWEIIGDILLESMKWDIEYL